MTAVVQPAGTVTLVFTDIEGSTRLLEELGTEGYRAALGEHRRIVREACSRYDGYEVDTEGDSFFYAFGSAQAAVGAVSDAMQGLAGGPVRVRVGIHTGEPALDPPNYIGMDVHRAARIMAAAHGGQVVLSPSTVALLEPEAAALHDLGEHRLKDLTAPIRLHQLELHGLPHEFPPLKTLYRSNLPVPANPFIGRETELAAVVERLTHSDTRLLTLTGPGGTGKTRLALQAAAQAADHYPDGITWIPLAPLRDPEPSCRRSRRRFRSANNPARGSTRPWRTPCPPRGPCSSSTMSSTCFPASRPTLRPSSGPARRSRCSSPAENASSSPPRPAGPSLSLAGRGRAALPGPRPRRGCRSCTRRHRSRAVPTPRRASARDRARRGAYSAPHAPPAPGAPRRTPRPVPGCAGQRPAPAHSASDG